MIASQGVARLIDEVHAGENQGYSHFTFAKEGPSEIAIP